MLRKILQNPEAPGGYLASSEHSLESHHSHPVPSVHLQEEGEICELRSEAGICYLVVHSPKPQFPSEASPY